MQREWVTLQRKFLLTVAPILNFVHLNCIDLTKVFIEGLSVFSALFINVRLIFLFKLVELLNFLQNLCEVRPSDK